MNRPVNICHWYGEANAEAIEILEHEGYRVNQYTWENGHSVSSEEPCLVIFYVPFEPSEPHAIFIELNKKESEFLVAWTLEEFEEAWYYVGADNVFIGNQLPRFKAKARSAAKLIEERRVQIEMAHTHERALEDLKVSVESLEVASKRFEALFNGLPVACFTFDSCGMIHEWNALSTEVFGMEAHEAFFNSVWDVLDPEGKGSWTQEIVTDIFDKRESLEFDWSYIRRDESEVHLACKVLCLKNRKGEVIAAVAGNLDITERVLAQRKVDEQVREIKSYLKTMERQRFKLQDANRQLRLLAVTDGLTGLMNRRRFNEQLDEVLDRAIRQNAKFSLLLFDIDHFKQLNDVFGHQAGDEILVKFSAVLRETARRYERPARYGGEEFAIILDNCDQSAAVMAAERFRSAILNYEWPFRKITASVGCSTFEGIETARGMIEHADTALYSSKRNGRNMVTHFDHLPDTNQEVA